MTLKEIFLNLCRKYSNNTQLADTFWKEIGKAYGSSSRYYHNLTHLEELLDQLNDCKSLLEDFDTILFSLFYHDVVYNTLKNNNEEKSAELAVNRLVALKIPQRMITACEELILATKHHHPSANSDTNFFTDADLSILGRPWPVYEVYVKNIRKEYSIYPDLVFNPGRRKVLEHFLSMVRIFKTPWFFDRFESQARANLQQELEILW